MYYCGSEHSSSSSGDENEDEISPRVQSVDDRGIEAPNPTVTPDDSGHAPSPAIAFIEGDRPKRRDSSVLSERAGEESEHLIATGDQDQLLKKDSDDDNKGAGDDSVVKERAGDYEDGSERDSFVQDVTEKSADSDFVKESLKDGEEIDSEALDSQDDDHSDSSGHNTKSLCLEKPCPSPVQEAVVVKESSASSNDDDDDDDDDDSVPKQEYIRRDDEVVQATVCHSYGSIQLPDVSVAGSSCPTLFEPRIPSAKHRGRHSPRDQIPNSFVTGRRVHDYDVSSFSETDLRHQVLSATEEVKKIAHSFNQKLQEDRGSGCGCFRFICIASMLILIFALSHDSTKKFLTNYNKLESLKKEHEAARLSHLEQTRELNELVITLRSKLDEESSRSEHLKTRFLKLNGILEAEGSRLRSDVEGDPWKKIEVEEKEALYQIIEIKKKMSLLEADSRESEALLSAILSVKKSILDKEQDLYRTLVQVQEKIEKKCDWGLPEMESRVSKLLASMKELTEIEGLPEVFVEKREEGLIKKFLLNEVLKTAAEFLEEDLVLKQKEKELHVEIGTLQDLEEALATQSLKQKQKVKRKLEALELREDNINNNSTGSWDVIPEQKVENDGNVVEAQKNVSRFPSKPRNRR